MYELKIYEQLEKLKRWGFGRIQLPITSNRIGKEEGIEKGKQMSTWSKLFQALMATEENVLPIFLHNPNSKTSQIVGALLVTETIFGAIFGLTSPTTPVPPPPVVG